MRPSAFLAAIPFVLGCARQSEMRAPTLPSDEPLHVRFQLSVGGGLKYTLSEPAYVAIFAITRGHGISMLFPYYASQADHRSHAGLNQETMRGSSLARGYSASARRRHRTQFGLADAYYIIASKYPLPVGEILQSPFLLRSLVGADAFRATNFTVTWAALEEILVAGLPDDSWASDVAVNWRDPFMTASSFAPPRSMEYCYGRALYAVPILYADQCSLRRWANSTAPPPVPVAEGPRHAPPERPRDREPSLPLPPDGGVALTARATESRPPQQPSRPEGKPQPLPQPDN